MSINPWVVDNIQAFYFLKCPECNFINKEESTFQDHAVENHPLSSAFYGESDKTIVKIGIFDDCNEENDSNDAFNTVKEELLETRNDHEMDEQIFAIENEVKQLPSETANDICPEDVAEVQEPATMIPLLTYEYAAAQIANAIPARESREILNEDLIINNVVGLDISCLRDQPNPRNMANHMVSLIRSPITLGTIPGTIHPAHESREILNEDPMMNNAVRLDSSQQMLTQPLSSNLISPSTVKNRKKKYKCLKCDASFTRRPNLKRHVESVHEGKKPFKCSICDSSFAQSGNLKKHIATVHEGQKPFKCSICDSSFTQSGDLKRHVAAVHRALIDM